MIDQNIKSKELTRKEARGILKYILGTWGIISAEQYKMIMAKGERGDSTTDILLKAAGVFCPIEDKWSKEAREFYFYNINING